MGLSAVVLTKNNAATIKDTLRSVSFADEVIVVDDNSTDATIALAKSMGAAVHKKSLNNDFAGQRNFGLSKAKGDWVLFVDSDERVSESLAREVREAVKQIDVSGFYLKRRDSMWGRALEHGETEHVRLMRLGKKGNGMWQRPVHEVWEVTGVVGTLSEPLDHFPHPDVAQFLYDINQYSSINARYLRVQGVKSSWWQILVYPTGKFIQNYYLRLGFLDGMPGMIMAVMMSFHSYLTRAKLWHLGKSH